MSGLHGRFVSYLPTTEGVRANILLIEDNGDEYPVKCLARVSGTDINGDPVYLDYLNQRYSPETVCAVARHTTTARLG
jgi:hypothetical protein